MHANQYLGPTTLTANTNHATVTRFAGFDIRESAGTGSAAANLRSGSATGQILFVLEITTKDNAAIVFPAHMPTPLGVYVEVLSGSVSGVLYSWK